MINLEELTEEILDYWDLKEFEESGFSKKEFKDIILNSLKTKDINFIQSIIEFFEKFSLEVKSQYKYNIDCILSKLKTLKGE